MTAVTTVNIEQAQSDLKNLLEEASHGEPFLVSREGSSWFKVRVELQSPADTAVDTSKRFGFLRGQGTVPLDFNTMYAEEIADMFESKIAPN